MNIFQFFRKKPKAVEVAQPLPSDFLKQVEEAKLEFTPEEKRQQAEVIFNQCLKARNLANTYCYFADKVLVDALIAEALSKTDDDDTINNSTLSTQK